VGADDGEGGLVEGERVPEAVEGVVHGGPPVQLRPVVPRPGPFLAASPSPWGGGGNFRVASEVDGS